MTNKHSKINLELNLSYLLLNKLLDEKLSNLELRSGVVVQSAQIAYQNDQIVLAIRVIGIIDSEVFAFFNVRMESGQLVLSDFSAKLGSQNILSSGINYMIERWFKKNLETRIQDIIDQQLLALIQSIILEERRIPMIEGLQLFLSVESIEIEEVIAQTDQLVFLVSGQAKIKIKG